MQFLCTCPWCLVVGSSLGRLTPTHLYTMLCIDFIVVVTVREGEKQSYIYPNNRSWDIFLSCVNLYDRYIIDSKLINLTIHAVLTGTESVQVSTRSAHISCTSLSLEQKIEECSRRTFIEKWRERKTNWEREREGDYSDIKKWMPLREMSGVHMALVGPF